MLPVLSQRILIPLAALLAGLTWYWAYPAFMPHGHGHGFSLFDGYLGPVFTITLFTLVAIPAVALAAILSAMANPLAGVFTFSIALLFPAIRGGAIDGWLWRHQAPHAYHQLALETLVWTAALIALLAIIDALRQPLRRALPRLATDDHFHPTDLGLRKPDARALLAALVCTGIAGTLTTLLLTVSDTGQVVGSLVLAFTLAAVLTHAIIPQPNPLPILLTPPLLAIVAYLHVPFRYETTDALFTAWYAGRLWTPALALPIHYLAAGLTGASLGLGISQSFEHTRHETTPAPA